MLNEWIHTSCSVPYCMVLPLAAFNGTTLKPLAHNIMKVL